MSSLILFLRLFTAFPYVTDRFVSISTKSTSSILLHLIYYFFDIVLMALFCAAIRIQSVSLLRFLFLSHVQVFSYGLFVQVFSYGLFVVWNVHTVFLPIFVFCLFFVLLMLVLSVFFLITVISLPPVLCYHYYYFLNAEISRMYLSVPCLIILRFLTIISIISIFGRFPHGHEMVVFHWSLSDCNSPRVSMTCLSTLADFKNTVVLIVSIVSLIFFYSLVTFSSSWEVSQVLQLQSVWPSSWPWCFTAFSSLWQDPSICFSFLFVLFFLEDRFWVVHIPFVRMVKFQFLAQFPVDHLAHPIGSSLQCQFAAFAYHVIERFVSIAT